MFRSAWKSKLVSILFVMYRGKGPAIIDTELDFDFDATPIGTFFWQLT
jgi:hypothetical protein